MSNQKMTDSQVRNWIIITIGGNEKGVSLEKLNKILRLDSLTPQLERVLGELEKSNRINLKGEKYQLTKRGREIFDALNKRE